MTETPTPADQDILNAADLGPQLVVSSLKASQSYPVEITPDSDALLKIAESLELLSLKKLRLTGTIKPAGKADWGFEGDLGATVTQPCVVTLEPVTTRLDEEVTRLWRADMPTFDALAPEEEVEVPEDVSEEPLGDVIDLGALLLESLALALPLYPRAADAALGEQVFTEPGKQAMTDEDAKPFAGLAALRDQLAGGTDEGQDD